MKEEPVQFGEAGSLVGIVATAPQGNEKKAAVILLNAGIVHRVGPGRIYVRIARALAARGFTVLRFDFSGIGDSTVRLDNCCFEKSSVHETRAAMDFLQTTRDITHFILLGGCSGAVVSLETARSDQRAIGAVLINYPASADEEEKADYRRDGHYYWNFALLSLRSWRKLLTGKSDYRKIVRALVQGLNRKFADRSKMSCADNQFRSALRQAADRGVHLTFICSKGDVLLRDLREAGGHDLKRLCAQGKIACEVIPRSDHTFSSLYDQERLVEVILKRASAAASTSDQQVHTPEIASSPVEALFQRP
jgi:pimeloyl-ACP methyl ester carboxylesterase